MTFTSKHLVLINILISLKLIRNIAKSVKFKSQWKTKKGKSVKLMSNKNEVFSSVLNQYYYDIY